MGQIHLSLFFCRSWTFDELFLGREEKEIQRFFSATGNNCGQKGRTFATPFGAGWRIEVNEVSK